MAAMQEAMKRPEAQQQMQQMAAAMQNQQLQQRMATLKVSVLQCRIWSDMLLFQALRNARVLLPSSEASGLAAGRPGACTHV